MNDIIISQIRQRLEILYQMVDELERSGGGGGEPGTTNYNDLTNKPSVNGHILIGSKTSSDLDLQPVISDLSTIRSGAAAGATAVQPATMNQALRGKQDTLTFDTTPTSGSTNPVTSGGVYTSLTTKVDKVTGKGLSTNDFTNADKAQITTNKNGIAVVANAGAKNLLKISATTQTINGVTFTVNSDGTITANGTNTGTGSSIFVIVPHEQAILIPDGNYYLSGCPEGGAGVPFDLRWYRYSEGKSAYNMSGDTLVTKSGNTIESNIAIVVRTGQTVNNIVFKPMLRDASIEDSTYVPYAPTNRELYEMILALQAGT